MVRSRIHDGEPDSKGVASIKGYALNRVPLIASRNAVVKLLRAQRLQILDRLQETLDDGIDREVALARARRAAQAMRANYGDDQPFTAMARAYAEEFEIELLGMAAEADG
jgi:hypothetical protein